MKKSLQEDSSAPTGGNYESPSGLLHLHMISSLFIPSFPLCVFSLCPYFFNHPIFHLSTPYSPSVSPFTFPSFCPLAFYSTACKLSSSFCSCPLFQSVIFLPPLSCPRSLPPSISLPCSAYLSRACIVIQCICNRLCCCGSQSWALGPDFHSSCLIRESFSTW